MSEGPSAASGAEPEPAGAPAATAAADLDDAALDRALRERERREREQAREAAAAVAPDGPCPVCDAPLEARALPWPLAALARRPGVSCAKCGFAAIAAPNLLGWLLAIVVAAALVAGGMSAIFSAQRIEDPSSQKTTFLVGAVLFAGGLAFGYREHNARNDKLLGQQVLARRRQRADAERRGQGEPPPEGDGWFQENLEAVVVAVILALIIRHFAMEAFVIPTGSMAPTLLGDHFRVECPNCGYEFALSKHEDDFIPGYDTIRASAECPLCEEELEQDMGRGDVYGGHKILVNKFVYDMRPPRRYEVMVFKFPSKPWKNYIKRLVGLPGETIEVRNGDVYADGKLARKPDHVQDAVWIPVHDSSYARADGAPSWRPVAEGREPAEVWAFDPDGRRIEARPQGAPTWLAYTRMIYDVYGYNRGNRKSRRVKVADVRVRAQVTPSAGAVVRLAMVESADGGGERVVSARFTAASQPGAQATVALEVDGEEQAHAAAPALAAGVPVELALAYADDRARLQVNGETVLAWDDPFGPSDTRSSNVRLGAEGAPVVFEQVRIDRDIFYTAKGGEFDPGSQPIEVPEGSYFCMGDNSPNSEDGRAWGFVREGHVVGRAFLVFWPIAPWEVKLIR